MRRVARRAHRPCRRGLSDAAAASVHGDLLADCSAVGGGDDQGGGCGVLAATPIDLYRVIRCGETRPGLLRETSSAWMCSAVMRPSRIGIIRSLQAGKEARTVCRDSTHTSASTIVASSISRPAGLKPTEVTCTPGVSHSRRRCPRRRALRRRSPPAGRPPRVRTRAPRPGRPRPCRAATRPVRARAEARAPPSR